MKKQSKSYWCGVASIANALEVLGIRRSQREVARLCHVTPEAGTSEEEMKRALLAQGVAVDEWHQLGAGGTTALSSMWWLQKHLKEAGPVILCVDECSHWVTVIGLCDQTTFIVFDPSRNQGVEVHSWDSLAARWLDSEDGYYGLGVSKKP